MPVAARAVERLREAAVVRDLPVHERLREADTRGIRGVVHGREGRDRDKREQQELTPRFPPGKGARGPRGQPPTEGAQTPGDAHGDRIRGHLPTRAARSESRRRSLGTASPGSLRYARRSERVLEPRDDPQGSCMSFESHRRSPLAEGQQATCPLPGRGEAGRRSLRRYAPWCAQRSRHREYARIRRGAREA